jgi:DNA-directed RNA polymerase specialized sigma24 family protein
MPAQLRDLFHSRQEPSAVPRPRDVRAAYSKFRAYLRAIAGRDVSPQDLDDLAHDALLVGLERIDSAYGESAICRYERTTIIHLLFRLRERWRRKPEALDEHVVEDAHARLDTQVIGRELGRTIATTLEAAEFELVVRRLQGESFAEIANDMRLRATTARSRYHRALAKLSMRVNMPPVHTG